MIDDIPRERPCWDALDFLFLVLIVGRVTMFVNEGKNSVEPILAPR